MFKISEDIGKVGEFVPVDFSKAEAFFDKNIRLERDGIYKCNDGVLILVNQDEVYVYRSM